MSAFAVIEDARRVFCLSGFYGDAERIGTLQRKIAPFYRPGDVFVYTGNVIGTLGNSREALDEVLLFRRSVLAAEGAKPGDVIFLKGVMEEIVRKLLQLHIAPKPEEAYGFIMRHGGRDFLSSYGIDPKEGEEVVRQGAVSIVRWIETVIGRMKIHDGHQAWFGALKYAAYKPGEGLLAVSAGLDPEKALEDQKEALWWGNDSLDFDGALGPWLDFKCTVRGHVFETPGHPLPPSGILRGPYTVTLQGREKPCAVLLSAAGDVLAEISP